MSKDPKQAILPSKQTRRSFLKYGAAIGSVALAAPMIIRKADADDKVLNWLTYSGHSADEVVGPFKEATGITIKAKEYADGEKMLALLHELDDASTMFADQRFEEVSAQVGQALKRAGLVGAHQGRIANHVGCENSGKPTFQPLCPPNQETTHQMRENP